MKRSFVIVLTLLLLAFLAGSALAERTNLMDRSTTAGKLTKAMSGQEEMPSGGIDLGPSNYSPNGSRGVVGITWYEYQHNGSMGRQIVWHATGGLHVSWMYRLASGCRDIHFCTSQNNGATWGPIAGGKPVSTVSPTCYNGGYTTIDVTTDGKALVAFHEGTVDYNSKVGEDASPPLGLFTWAAAPNGPNCQGIVSGTVEDGIEYIWPIVEYDLVGGTDPIAHVVSNENAGLETSSIIYYRYHLGNREFNSCVPNTDDTLGNYIDESDVTSAVIRSDPGSDKVAIVYHKYFYPPGHPNNDCEAVLSSQWTSDILYQESTNGGLSFIDGTAALVNVTDYTNGQTIPATQIPYKAYADLSALYGTDGFLHIVWNTPVYDITDPANPCSPHYATKLWHWSSQYAPATNIALVFDGTEPRYWLAPSGNDAFGAFNISTAKMNISECDGRFYVSFTRFGAHKSDDSTATDYSDDTYANGDIFLTASSDGGITWGPDAAATGVEGDGTPWNVNTATDLTNTITDGCAAGDCLSEHWSSMAKYSTGNVHIFYVEDHDAGAAIRNDPQEGELTSNNMVYINHPCFAPEGTFAYTVAPTGAFVPIAPNGGVDCTIGYTSTFNVTITNGGNVPINYVATAGANVTPASQSGTITAGINNELVLTFTAGPIAVEGSYASTVTIDLTSTEGSAQVIVDVDILVRCLYYVPEYEILSTSCWSVGVWNVPRSGIAQRGNEGNMQWFNDTVAPMYDNGVVISYADDLKKTYFSCFDGSDSTMGFEPLGVVTSVPTGTYEFATGMWCTPDTAVIGTIEYYVPIHPDTCVLIERFWITNAADTAIRLHVGEAIDWDIPDSLELNAAGSDNIGGFNAAREMVYQTGPDRPWATDLIDYCAGARFVDPIPGAICLENDRWIYPNSGYFPDSLGNLMRTLTGYTVQYPDSVEDRNCVYAVAQDLVLEPGECISYCKVKASSLIGVGRTDGTDNGSLFNLIDKGKQWAIDHNLDGPGCPGQISCTIGDADGSGGVDIDDVVYLIAYIFTGGPPPVEAVCCGDADGSGGVDIDDVVYLIAYIFTGGPPPVATACD
ncbi:MAG: hypothetical protein KKH67_07995 [candidate division Zixibacteria bacterium]|nr:hypothetical protein [candidate division Zixibacteria bacterium]